MRSAVAVYQPRALEGGVLHAVIREHLETFLAEAARASEGPGLPAFVEQEFRDYLTCGVLAHGFARVRCDACAFERLVPLACTPNPVGHSSSGTNAQTAGGRARARARWRADQSPRHAPAPAPTM